jgi:hypothetical protein
MGDTQTTPAHPVAAHGLSGRDRAIDFTRGVCIISMICAHIAGDSGLHAVTHVLVWVDGSMGFVFLAGVVLGMVRRRTSERFGLRHTTLVTLARTRLIYVAHVLITLLALVVGTVATGSDGVSAETYGWPESILRTLVLALNPPLSILGLWVVLLLVAVPALYLLGKGYLWLMLCLSFAAYAAGKAIPFATGLPGQGSDQAFQVEAWQFLFCLGLAIGWVWREDRVQRFIASRRILAAALVFVVLAAVLAHFAVRAQIFTGLTETLLLQGFSKLDLGPAAIAFSLAVALVIYSAAKWAAGTRVAPAMRPVTLLGSYSLDSYIISTIAAITLPAALHYDQAGRLAELLAIAVVAACLAWAYGRKALKIRA